MHDRHGELMMNADRYEILRVALYFRDSANLYWKRSQRWALGKLTARRGILSTLDSEKDRAKEKGDQFLRQYKVAIIQEFGLRRRANPITGRAPRTPPSNGATDITLRQSA